MTLLVAWILFPALLALLSFGCGLLVKYASGERLPPGLLLPAGLALMIVAASLTTALAATAVLTTPLIVTLAVVGLGLAFPWRNLGGDRWAALSALGVFAVYAAPVVLSGQATFAGYIKLDDTSTFLAFVDRAMQHGHGTAGLAPSTYDAVLTVGNGYAHYPLGAILPLGTGSQLIGVDPAWLYQPTIAFYAAMLALALGSLLVPLVRSRGWRALAAFVAAQAALLYGYALWGGIKELAAAATIVTAAALAPTSGEELHSLRRLIPFTLACAAPLAVLNVSAGVWLLPLGLPALIVVIRRRAKRPSLSLFALVGLTAAFSLPALVIAPGFLTVANSNWNWNHGLVQLIRRLSPLQMFGIWPSGDFRLWPHERLASEILIAVAALAAVAALVIALRRRLWRLPVLVASVLISALVLAQTSAPWLAAKAYALASPALVLAALALAAVLWERRFRLEGGLLALLIVGGVFWSSALAYHDVWLAPRAQLLELERIGDRFAGQGPTLMTEYQPYGVRHFLRRMDAEAASELRARPVYLTNGTMLGKAEYADLDRFALSSLLVYRTLVLRRSPVESRPPAPFTLVWRGRYYEVWRRPEPLTSSVLEHLGLGDGLHAAAPPSCSEVVRLGELAAGAGGRLVAAARTNSALLELATAAYPRDWRSDPSTQTVSPTSAGVLSSHISVPKSGVYTVYLGGSFARTVTISIDGRSAGSHSRVLSENGQWVPFGSLRLGAGVHTVSLRYGGSELAPGSGAGPFALGPLALSPAGYGDLVSVAPAKARSLCGRSLDWVEGVGP